MEATKLDKHILSLLEVPSNEETNKLCPTQDIGHAIVALSLSSEELYHMALTIGMEGNKWGVSMRSSTFYHEELERVLLAGFIDLLTPLNAEKICEMFGVSVNSDSKEKSCKDS